jgi:predicted GIY-YIG superfamily endonuclease
MTPQELIDQNKTFSEELQQWIVPLIFVDEALRMKSAIEVEQSIKQLEEVMQELNLVINKIND